MKRSGLIVIYLAGLIATSAPASSAHAFGFLQGGITQVLLISVDGMHNADFLNCTKGLTTVNHGVPYCPNLSTLAKQGAVFFNASITGPSYPIAGLMALVTGGSPRSTGVYSEIAFDRILAPPKVTTGKGLMGGTCTANVNNGTSTEYDEGIDINPRLLNGGAPSGEGGANAINTNLLVRNPFNNCAPALGLNPVILGAVRAEQTPDLYGLPYTDKPLSTPTPTP